MSTNSTETPSTQSQHQISAEAVAAATAAAAAKMKLLDGCKLINVNITSSSPPDQEENSAEDDDDDDNETTTTTTTTDVQLNNHQKPQQNNINNNNTKTMSIIRANSASHGSRVNTSAFKGNSQPARSQCNSRKSSTITFQMPDIKRPNSTTGIPTSGGLLPTSQSLYNSFAADHATNENCQQNHSQQNYHYGNHQQYYQQQNQQNYHQNYKHQQQFVPYQIGDDYNNTDFMVNGPCGGGDEGQMDAETPELDLFSPGYGFNPVREKAASLTLPDPKLHLLRKGSSNPFLTTSNSSHSGQWSSGGSANSAGSGNKTGNGGNNRGNNQNGRQRGNGHQNRNNNNYNYQQHKQTKSASVSPGQYSLPGSDFGNAGGRTSIILNGNILHSISPLPPGRPPAPGGGGGLTPTQNLSIHVQDASHLTGSVNFADVRCLGPGPSSLKPRGSTMSTMSTAHRSSYIGDDEHTHLHQQYLATTGRKDTIISIGRNLQIQFRSPSTTGLAWRYRTKLEKFLLFLLTVLGVVVFSYFFIPLPLEEGKFFNVN